MDKRKMYCRMLINRRQILNVMLLLFTFGNKSNPKQNNSISVGHRERYIVGCVVVVSVTCLIRFVNISVFVF
jgi:hypothetical protein